MYNFLNLLLAIVPGIITFLVSYFLIRKWINIAKKTNYLGKDMNKYEKPLVAEIGGLYSIIGIIFGILIYIGLKVYIFNTNYDLVDVFAILTILSLVTIIGLFDDILGWKKGLKPWEKPLLTFILALPLIIISAGNPYMQVPFIGIINLGLLYPLFIVPIIIMGTSNGFNMLAGYNGLEASLGGIILFILGVKLYMIGQYYLSEIALISLFGILAFLIFNWYPSKVFPGNSFTYGIGALFGTLVILGNLEQLGFILFIPYFIELILFIRGLLNHVYKENFGIPNEKNELNEPYKKVYSLTHLAIKLDKKIFKRATEKSVVFTIIFIEILFSILGILYG
ncbi:phospho-N-acetylmuramoyl-pentapeptide-transferase [Nanobdella aerobiophila]|uniref:Phospho-N-acetylmuramoyl-pentapeptide-transferase n=1 Tax=Nanobdella aerobiophila TaxID=2586965 RepID=A0A915SKW1_9ARCH|nr:glycosyltransferase 4 family protein [Nanobdella aerobiophila]BBL45601.1 phospho-N-acetylmuramoyl-pentapeptide-transferase [Nanobdella aerobiophila]